MKTFLRLFPVVFILSLCMGLTACSSDDESNDSLVGTWSGVDEDGDIVSITFTSKGTFSWTGIYLDELEEGPETESGTYEYKDGMITLYYPDSSNTVTVSVVSITSTTLTLKNENGTVVLTKQEESVTDSDSASSLDSSTSSLIGTWIEDEGDNVLYTFTFETDGSFTDVLREKVNGVWQTEYASGKYIYKNGELILYYYEDGVLIDTWTLTVISITSTTLAYKEDGESVEYWTRQ